MAGWKFVRNPFGIILSFLQLVRKFRWLQVFVLLYVALARSSPMVFMLLVNSEKNSMVSLVMFLSRVLGSCPFIVIEFVVVVSGVQWGRGDQQTRQMERM